MPKYIIREEYSNIGINRSRTVGIYIRDKNGIPRKVATFTSRSAAINFTEAFADTNKIISEIGMMERIDAKDINVPIKVATDNHVVDK